MLPTHTCFHRHALAFIFLVAAAGTVRTEEEKKTETNVTVATATVVRTTLHAYVTGYGNAEPAPVTANEPAGGAKLAAGVAGLVTKVNASEGMSVEKGTVLVQLDARAADAAVLRAQVSATAAEKARARQTQLSAAEGTSERAIQEAEAQLAAAKGELAAAQQMQSLLAIRAPISGTITRLQIRPGEWVDAGKDIGEVIDLNRLTIAVQVPAGEAGAIQAGQKASAHVRFGGSEKPLAEGTVQFISPQVSAANDSVLVRLAVRAGSALKPGQFVAVQIAVEEKANCLAVPVASVVTEDGGAFVAVVENNKAARKPVKTGLRDGELVEIQGDGITEGTTVVTTGAYGLPKETAVTIRKP